MLPENERRKLARTVKKYARKIGGTERLAKSRLKVSDSAALAEDLSAETSTLDLGAVVDTLAKTGWGDGSTSANTLGAQRAELWSVPREMPPL